MEHKNTETSNPEQDIKCMNLYSQVDRIYTELKEIGFDENDSLNVDDVNKFDQYHYFGTETIDAAIKRLHIGLGDTVLDVGAGLGGPARYLASRCKCHVVAIELQQDLHDTAVDLTRRCGLADNIRHVHANFITDQFDCDPASCLISLLTFLHISEKEKLFNRCRAAMKHGGKMYIEDFFLEGELTHRERTLVEKAYATLSTREQYIQQVTDSRFTDVQLEDMTSKWTPFVVERADKYRANRERHERVHGRRVYAEQQQFYDDFAELLTGGHVRGCLVTATAN